MTKTMYCPMSFANRSLTEPHYMSTGDQYGPYIEEVKPWMECTPNCAWAVIDPVEKDYCCGMALMAANLSNARESKLVINWLAEDDDE